MLNHNQNQAGLTGRKICFVVSSPLSATSFLLEPIRRLSQQNEIYLIANLKSGESIEKIPASVRVFSVGIERKVSPWRDFLAALQIFKIFQQYKFDIVHSLTPKAGLLAMLAANLARVHFRLHTFTGQVWATRSGFSRRLLSTIDRIIASLASHVLVDSRSQRDFLINEKILLTERSTVLHRGSVSGVDLHRFKQNPAARSDIRESLEILLSDTVFLYIGRLNRDKGLLDLANAFCLIHQQYPDSILLVVGPDEEGMQSEMMQILASCADRVRFVGFADKPEDFMAASDVLCLPSYREGFGNVVIEAAAVGIPAVGSRIYGLIDAIEDEKTGLLFDVRNINSLASVMALMSANVALREKLGKQAKERAIRDFSSEKLGDAWLEFYKVMV